MIRTHAFPCWLPKPEADALNQESGRIYSRVMVNHYRVYRQSGEVWLSQYDAMKLTDFYDAQDGQERLLHAHSVDAAQEGFYKACKTAKACKQAGLPMPTIPEAQVLAHDHLEEQRHSGGKRRFAFGASQRA